MIARILIEMADMWTDLGMHAQAADAIEMSIKASRQERREERARAWRMESDYAKSVNGLVGHRRSLLIG